MMHPCLQENYTYTDTFVTNSDCVMRWLHLYIQYQYIQIKIYKCHEDKNVQENIIYQATKMLRNFLHC